MEAKAQSRSGCDTSTHLAEILYQCTHLRPINLLVFLHKATQPVDDMRRGRHLREEMCGVEASFAILEDNSLMTELAEAFNVAQLPILEHVMLRDDDEDRWEMELRILALVMWSEHEGGMVVSGGS